MSAARLALAARAIGRLGALRARRSRGFTFIELMIVIAIVGLMATIIVANLDGLTDEARLAAAARELGNTILTVRDIAATQGRELDVEIDVEGNRWRIIDIPSPTDVPDLEERRDRTRPGVWQTPPEGVVLASLEFSRTDVSHRGVVMIAFDADGQISPAGFVAYFQHESMAEDDGVSVEVTGLTGLVSYVHGKVRSEEVRAPDDF